ncbi:magnesium transporter [Syntrophorhabdus aromaticivorans]|uniref:Magnesium transporter MgtE n=1 Tax=Syntrophorhabdus aromaticivorans TaxID=328301 RepID=A0A971M597_9BACT|nr:magnesium transporter [Syntrophorhabdus aromaticivorans]NLW35381.1 magnesium transporter [Syntrophorhabdus aromaticivorans]
MKNKNLLLIPDVREIIMTGDAKALQDFCQSGHPAVTAELMSTLSGDEAWAIIRHADTPLRADIFSHLSGDLQVEIIRPLSCEEVALLLADMSPDDRADLFKQMPEDLSEAVLPALAQAEREDIRRLSAYKEGTAGAVMTSDYASLSPHLTASQAIERLREVAPNKETIYYAYVVDDNLKLLGFVSLKDLVVARREARVGDIMHREAIFARVEEDQEDAARKIQKYDLLALPVLNGNDALVGIITHDDAIDIITQEQTEDMEKLMAITGSHENAVYMKTSVWGHFRNRCPWVIVLAILGLVSGFIVQNFEGLLMQFTVLAAFMPMLAATGGNTGSQSATLVVRALALKEISSKDIFRVLAREFRVALMLAVLLGVIAFVRVLFFGSGSSIPDGYSLARIGFAISLALILQVVTSTLIGALLPLGTAKMKCDPAVVASPTLATIVDITGLLIYFTTAKLLLGI